MDNATHKVEETKEGAFRDDQHGNDSQNTSEQIVEEITHLLNTLFDPNNLSNNAYLINKANGASFHIPVKFIYEEYSIKVKTHDRELINQAIEKAENVVANKRGDIIESVKPAHEQLRKNITVKGIARDDENKFKELVYAFPGAQEAISNWKANQQLNLITIICRDEQFATELFNHLVQTRFKDSPIDCALLFESLYIASLENLKNRKHRYNDHQQHPQNRVPYGMNNMMYAYPMQPPFFYNQMNNGFMKNFYPQNNFYMPNPGVMNPMQMPMGPNMNGSMNRPQNNYNRGGGGGGKRGGFNKRGRGSSRGGRYHKNGYQPSNQQPANVEVNDSDFPPLSNDNQDEQQ